jgi:hypothetical protein
MIWECFCGGECTLALIFHCLCQAPGIHCVVEERIAVVSMKRQQRTEDHTGHLHYTSSTRTCNREDLCWTQPCVEPKQQNLLYVNHTFKKWWKRCKKGATALQPEVKLLCKSKHGSGVQSQSTESTNTIHQTPDTRGQQQTIYTRKCMGRIIGFN